MAEPLTADEERELRIRDAHAFGAAARIDVLRLLATLDAARAELAAVREELSALQIRDGHRDQVVRENVELLTERDRLLEALERIAKLPPADFVFAPTIARAALEGR